jgi:hypothetical protein
VVRAIVCLFRLDSEKCIASHGQSRRARCGRDSRDLLFSAPGSAEVVLLLRNYVTLLGMWFRSPAMDPR